MKNRFSGDQRQIQTSQKQRVKMVMEERRKKLLFNTNQSNYNGGIQTPSMQRTIQALSFHDDQITNIAAVSKGLSLSSNTKNLKSAKQLLSTDLIADAYKIPGKLQLDKMRLEDNKSIIDMSQRKLTVVVDNLSDQHMQLGLPQSTKLVAYSKTSHVKNRFSIGQTQTGSPQISNLQNKFFQNDNGEMIQSNQKSFKSNALRFMSPTVNLQDDGYQRPGTTVNPQRQRNRNATSTDLRINLKHSEVQALKTPKGYTNQEYYQTQSSNADQTGKAGGGSATNRMRLRNQQFLSKLNQTAINFFNDCYIQTVISNLEQLQNEVETHNLNKNNQDNVTSQSQIHMPIQDQLVNVVTDFSQIFTKFLQKLSQKIEQTISQLTESQTKIITLVQEKDLYKDQLVAYKDSDYQPGEKNKLLSKINRLIEKVREKERQLEVQRDMSSKNDILSKIKVEEYQREVNRLSSQNNSENQQQIQIQEKQKAFNEIINKLDSDLKMKDKLIVKLQWSKGELKDQLLESDKKLQELQKQHSDLQTRNDFLEREMEAKLVYVQQIDIKYDNKKKELYALQEDFRRKIETFETLKAVAKEIQKKNEELEKEVWMGKGGSKESDPVGAEVLIDQFLFGSQNPYALSNNTKLSVNLRGKDLRIGNSGLEQTVIKEGDMRKIELTDEQQVANQSTIIPRHQLQGYDGENEQVVNFKEFPLYSYFYGRPNFIIFIDHLIKDPNSNINYSTINDPPKKFKFNPPFSTWLFSTCRAILDSKYYEYVLYEDIGFTNVSRLADFVYSWLGNFRVDEATREVRQLDFEEREKADDLRLQFAIGLQSVKASRVWEYQLFNDFLMEKNSSNDELYFYLHCRQVLFKGPQLLDSSATHERIFSIDLKRVSTAIDVLFSKMTREDREGIINQIKAVAQDYQEILLQQQSKRDEKSKQNYEKYLQAKIEEEKANFRKKEIEAIDSSIILRVFVEYYIREKKVRAFILKRLFEEQPRLGTSSKAGISFYSFKKIMEQFDPDMLEIDIAKYYRDAWTAGIGVVNFDSFFLVANENGIFLKSVRFMSFNTPPTMNSYEEFDLDSKYSQKLDYVYNLWRKEDNLFTNLKRRIDECGNEVFVQKFTFLENLLRKKSQLDLSMYRGRDMIQVFRRLWQWVLFFRAAYMEVYEREEQCNGQTVSLEAVMEEFNNYKLIGNRIFKELALVKSQQLKRANQIKKIQKIYREQKNIEWEQLQQKLLA
eukprot:403355053